MTGIAETDKTERGRPLGPQPRLKRMVPFDLSCKATRLFKPYIAALVRASRGLAEFNLDSPDVASWKLWLKDF
jgi:hypothetical protein